MLAFTQPSSVRHIAAEASAIRDRLDGISRTVLAAELPVPPIGDLVAVRMDLVAARRCNSRFPIRSCS
jgi:hypothetical protein